MNKKYTSFGIAARIWILTSAVFGAGWMLVTVLFFTRENPLLGILAGVCAAIGTIPVLIFLYLLIGYFNSLDVTVSGKIRRVVISCYCCALPYAILGGSLLRLQITEDWIINIIAQSLIMSALLFVCSVIAMSVIYKKMLVFFSADYAYSTTQTIDNMETIQQPDIAGNTKPDANKILFKGIITGVLILVMLIPTVFVSSLVTERQQRQQEVVSEVSSKWANAQTISAPYLFIPYRTNEIDKDGKYAIVKRQLFILPDQLNVASNIIPEVRPRSIYKVLLYKSDVNTSGHFIIHLPKDIDPTVLQLDEAKICFGISDFKGIEEKLVINFKDTAYELSPGLPSGEIDDKGLSAPVPITISDLGQSLAFKMSLKLKGSERLHFLPLAGNSRFTLQSTWNGPSFDGATLPTERSVSDSGFAATWTFNKANLPFSTVLKELKLDKAAFDFGVTMVQPADQYAKTSRSVKYAILFIGLTFSLFFIVELMQKKPVHPVQYVLVGIALVIFYTLLLSIGEFLLFDQAYLISAAATVLLIALYAKSHFRSWGTSAVFASVLAGLYGFIFILIRLEDTALLVGSIGLFVVLALVMYASRKINWYGTNVKAANTGIA
jgi:inner membrane protein